MATIVIGGHSRNIGKTSVVCELIAALPQFRWTAIKITQFGHGVCSADGKPCGCETADHALAVTEERDSTSGADSSRYLAAGAERSLWVRTRMGDLGGAMPRIRVEIERSQNVILESNSVLRFLRPDIYVAVLDPKVADFKASALRYLDRADAIVFSGDTSTAPMWKKVSPKLIERIPTYQGVPPRYCSAELIDVILQRLRGAPRSLSTPPLQSKSSS